MWRISPCEKRIPFFFPVCSHFYKEEVVELCLEIGRSVSQPAGRALVKGASVGWAECTNTQPPEEWPG